MRISKKQAAQNRQTILETAGRLFRERGYERVGLAEIMQAAGFSHGGFYNHFASKEALAEEVAASELARTGGRLERVLAGEVSVPTWGGPTPKPGLGGYVESYLSLRHRDDLGAGCALVGLADDATREANGAVGPQYASGVERHLALLEKALQPAEGKKARRVAIETLAQMAGAMMLARALKASAPELSEEMLKVNRKDLLKTLNL